jgi:hypothetical protein
MTDLLGGFAPIILPVLTDPDIIQTLTILNRKTAQQTSFRKKNQSGYF